MALLSMADEIKEITEKYSRLSDKSQKMIDALINATYQLENRCDELKGETFKIEVTLIED